MSEWKKCERTWSEFRRTSMAKAGVEIRTADGTEYLIGDINENGGFCDDCALDADTKIVAYRVLVER